MPLCLTPQIERIARGATGRHADLCAADVQGLKTRLLEQVKGRRVLVVGGAGSIGSATIMQLLPLRPRALTVLDTNENNLAELLRTIRSADQPFDGDLLVQPLDYGSPLATRFLAGQPPYDLVMSFAALKHVRSERDEWSLTRMLEVNLCKADRFLAAIRKHGHGQGGVFFVSTDKAADPVSLMGASKRAMELLLWAHCEAGAPASLLDGGVAPPARRMTTARFANVAFSDGSLPWGFLQRLEKQQPLACPGDVRRYLVTPIEAGQICLIGALICPHRHMVIPRLNPDRDLVRFTDIAAATLRDHGLAPVWFKDPEQARRAVLEEKSQGRYPVLVTQSDTSGEKEVEQFVGADEVAIDIGLEGVQAVAAGRVDIGALTEVLSVIDRAATGAEALAKMDLVAALKRLVPELDHRDTGKSLDKKM